MENTLHVALSHQMVLRTNMEVIASNIANASTVGFKGEHLMFTEYVDQVANQEPVSFVRDYGMVRDFKEGSFERTGNSLDLAIRGEGWFTVETPLGTRYTRNGQFTLNADGEVVTSEGYRLLSDADTPIVLEPGDSKISITADGVLTTQSGATPINIVAFEDQSALHKVSNTMYRAAPDVDPAPAENAQVVQGVLEGSNVQAILEITDMIQTMRDYQATQKIIEEEHNRQRGAIQQLTEEAK